jgi:hypothetical protein
MSKDIDTIAAELRDAEARATSIRARLQKWTLRYEQETGGQKRSQANHWRTVANEDLRKAETRVRALRTQYQKAENEMMRDDDAKLPWRVALGSLNFGGTLYPRGSVVPDHLVESCANSQHLISAGHLRRMPGTPAKQAKPAPTPVVAEPYVPVDHCKVLYDAMVALAAKRKCAIGDTEDAHELLDLRERAVKQFCDEPQVAMSTAWGGNNHPTQSGVGTARRIFDVMAFRKRLYSYGQEMVK